MAGTRSPETVAAAAVALLLPVAYSPSVYATFWSPKSAVLMVGGGFGLTRLPALVRSDARRPAVAALVFLGVAAVSTVLSPEPVGALLGLYNWGTGLVFVACLVGVWALGACADRDDPLVRRALLAGCVASASLALLQTVVEVPLPVLEDTGRASGLAGNAGHLGTIAVLGLAIASSSAHRVALGAVVLFAAAVQLSGTRSALAMAVLVVVAVGGRRGWARFGLLVGALALGIAAGGWLAAVGGVATATDRSGDRELVAGPGGGVRVRLEVWSYARHAVADRPIVGHGPGRFRAATSDDRTLAVVQAEGHATSFADAHNLVVEYAVTTGILGVGALLWWLTTALRSASGPLLTVALGALAMSLVQPQSVGTTPLILLALGAASAAAVPRPTRRAVPLVAVAAIAAVGLLVGDAALLAARDSLSLDPARRADSLLGGWPQPASMLARVHVFRSQQEPPGPSRDVESRAVRRWRRNAVERDRTDPALWIALAADELHDGRLDDAEAHYLEAIRLDPYAAAAMTGLAEVYEELGEEREAARWLARARAIDPGIED